MVLSEKLTVFRLIKQFQEFGLVIGYAVKTRGMLCSILFRNL